jgi:hypothetical protein
VVGFIASPSVLSVGTVEKPDPTALHDRLSSLSESMRESARLVEGMSTELDQMAQNVQQLQSDAEVARVIASVNGPDADVLRKYVDAEFANSERRIRRDNLIIGIVGLVVGAVITLLITLLVHPPH